MTHHFGTASSIETSFSSQSCLWALPKHWMSLDILPDEKRKYEIKSKSIGANFTSLHKKLHKIAWCHVKAVLSSTHRKPCPTGIKSCKASALDYLLALSSMPSEALQIPLVTAIGFIHRFLPTTSSSYTMDHDTIADAIRTIPHELHPTYPEGSSSSKTKNNLRTTSCIPASDFWH